LISSDWNFLNDICDSYSGVGNIDIFISSVYNNILLDLLNCSVYVFDDWLDNSIDNWNFDDSLIIYDFFDVFLNGMLNWSWNILDGDLWDFDNLVGEVFLDDWHFNFLDNLNNFDIFNFNFDWNFFLLNSVIVNSFLDILGNFNNFNGTWFFNWDFDCCFDNFDRLDINFSFLWYLVDFD